MATQSNTILVYRSNMSNTIQTYGNAEQHHTQEYNWTKMVPRGPSLKSVFANSALSCLSVARVASSTAAYIATSASDTLTIVLFLMAMDIVHRLRIVNKAILRKYKSLSVTVQCRSLDRESIKPSIRQPPSFCGEL